MSELLISAFFLIITQLYIVGKTLKTELAFRNLEKNLIAILLMLFTAYLYSFSASIIRVIVVVIILSIGNYFIFNKSFERTILATFLANTLFGISEIIFVIFMMTFFTLEQLKADIFGNLITNICICLISVILFNIPIIKKALIRITEFKFKNSKFWLVTFSFVGIFITTISIYSAYYRLSSTTLIFVIIIFILIYSFISYKFFFERTEKETAQQKNDILIKNIMEYEKIIETQKIDAHENKNQLRIISQMVNPKNKKLTEYINVLLDERTKEDKKLINKVSNIPSGGLRALIYSKLVCLDESYDITIIVSRTINIKTLDSIDSETNVQMCQIMGVFLDNAIEATSFTNKKMIAIDLYCQNDTFRITVSNTFVGEVELDKMSNAKYTTKGINRGFGLTLVKNIIDKNNKLRNEKFITNNIFSQVLYIDLK